MKDKEFNLLDEPWIRVIDKNCSIHEISLIEVFGQAHRYKDLCGELPTQDFAMMRLLLAVLHAVFSRYDGKGKAAPLDDAEHALGRWKELWQSGGFPAEAITEYLETQRERFYLFHPERPFYQCERAKIGTEYYAAKLNGNLSESSNKPRLFTNISGKAKEEMDFSEAARWLLYVNAYDDTSAKPSGESKKQGIKLPSAGAGWLGKLGIVFVRGDNLFETLMLNLIMVNEREELFGKECPVWEREEVAQGERTKIQWPNNLSELYTLQSRRIYLKRKGQRVTGYYLLGGDFFDKENAFIEPMTVWKNPDRKKINDYVPRRHDFSKQFWRECPAVLLNDKEDRQPGIAGVILAYMGQKASRPPFPRVCGGDPYYVMYSGYYQLLYFIRIHAVSSSLFLPCFAVLPLSCCFMLFMFYFTIVVKIVVKTPSNKYKARQKEKAPRQQGFHSFKVSAKY